jgi:hypothetical protein
VTTVTLVTILLMPVTRADKTLVDVVWSLTVPVARDRRILTRKELSLLVRSGALRQILGLISTTASDEAMSTVAYKSIHEARKEKRGGVSNEK